MGVSEGITIYTYSGKEIPVDISISPMQHSAESGVIVSIRDKRQIAKINKKMRALDHAANHDALTGLKNRHYLQKELPRIVNASREYAILLIDLDGFKPVNDTHGHQVGDQLLAEAAMRIIRRIRKGDTPIRMGGDEFLVLLRETSELTAVRTIAEHIISSLSMPFDLNGSAIQVTASIGASIAPIHGTEFEDLLTIADENLYHAKRRGKNQVVATPPPAQVLTASS